jgi:glycosyltransferase involved in cell wall biosynthesis
MLSSNSSNKGLLVITQVYKPEPGFITADVAEFLARREPVTVVTAHPNYPYGRFYSGARFWRVERTMENGVTIWRLPFFPDHSRSIGLRTISYLSFALVASIVSPFVAGRPRAVWVYHGPFTTGLAAIWFQRFSGARLIFTCADLWPESFAAAGLASHRFLMKILYAYRNWLNRRADDVICSTKGTATRLAEGGCYRNRLHYVPVWIPAVEEPTTDRVSSRETQFRVVYAGNLGPAQDLDTILYAALELQTENLPIVFDVYGSGNRETDLRQLAARLGLRNLTFHGRVSSEAAFSASTRASAQVVSLQSSQLFEMTIPSKLFFSFAAGTPILFGLRGEAAELAAESRGGIRFEAGDPASLAGAIKALLATPLEERDRMGARLREFYDNNFRPNLLLKRYEEILLAPSVAIGRDGLASDLEPSRVIA